MKKFVVAIAVLTLLTSLFGVALNSGNTASAWKVDHSASSYCEGNTAYIDWSFSNTEPNQARYSMDLVVRDEQTGKETAKQTVTPGQTVNGTIDTMTDTLNADKVAFILTWTDGRNGVDTRYSSYDAVTDCYEEEVCEHNPQLPVDDPNCFEPCEFDETLPADHEDCGEVEGEVTPPVETLPETGAAGILLGAFGLSAVGATGRSWLESRK